MRNGNAFRRGRVHVMGAMCSTCIFNPKTRPVDQTRVDGMVKEAIQADSAIICHSTLTGGDHAVCRGFFNNHATTPLCVARLMNVIAWVPEK